MQRDNSVDYYQARQRHALARAELAADDYIREIHLILAREYGRRAGQQDSPLLSVPGTRA